MTLLVHDIGALVTGLILLVLGQVVQVLVRIVDAQRPRLSYSINGAGVSAVAKQDHVKDDGTFYPVVYYHKITIQNSGSVPITRNDFDEPIAFRLIEGNVIDVSVSKGLDTNLTVEHDDSSFRVPPLLVNPRDSLVFEVLATGKQFDEPPVVRITGVKKATPIKTRRLTMWPSVLQQGIVLDLSLMAVIVYLKVHIAIQLHVSVVTWIGLGAVLVVVIVLAEVALIIYNAISSGRDMARLVVERISDIEGYHNNS